MPTAFKDKLRHTLVRGIVLGNQHARAANLRDLCGLLCGARGGTRGKTRRLRDFGSKVDSDRLRIPEWYLVPERTPRADGACQTDLPAHQRYKLARNGRTKARSTIYTC